MNRGSSDSSGVAALVAASPARADSGRDGPRPRGVAPVRFVDTRVLRPGEPYEPIDVGCSSATVGRARGQWNPTDLHQDAPTGDVSSTDSSPT